jgi:hypothetical protein
MTSTEAYNFGLSLINQPASGNWTVEMGNRFLNHAQREYLDELIKDGIDSSIMANEALSPFFVNSTVMLTNGIGTHSPANDLAYGPTIWASGYQNPACGETNTGDPELIPAKRLTEKGWAARTRNLIDTTSTYYPVWRLYDTIRIQVRPTSLRFVACWYVRYPRPIVIGSVVDANGIVRPSEGAPNQVNPEWADIDMEKIVWKAVGYTGLALQSDRMQQTSMMNK